MAQAPVHVDRLLVSAAHRYTARPARSVRNVPDAPECDCTVTAEAEPGAGAAAFAEDPLDDAPEEQAATSAALAASGAAQRRTRRIRGPAGWDMIAHLSTDRVLMAHPRHDPPVSEHVVRVEFVQPRTRQLW